MSKNVLSRLVVTGGLVERLADLQRAAAGQFEVLACEQLQQMPSLDSGDWLLLQFDALADLPAEALLQVAAEGKLRRNQLVWVQGQKVLVRQQGLGGLQQLLSAAGLQVALAEHDAKAAAWRDFAEHELVLATYGWCNTLAHTPKKLALNWLHHELTEQLPLLNGMQQQLWDLLDVLKADGSIPWEASKLLDTLSGLMLVQGMLDLRGDGFPAAEADDYAGMIRHALHKFTFQLMRVLMLHHPESVMNWFFEQPQGGHEAAAVDLGHCFPFSTQLSWELPDEELLQPAFKMRLCLLKSLLIELPLQPLISKVKARLTAGGMGENSYWHFEIDMHDQWSVHQASKAHPHERNTQLLMQDLFEAWTGGQVKWTHGEHKTHLLLSWQGIHASDMVLR